MRVNKHADDPKELDERLDEAISEENPASDPVAVNDIIDDAELRDQLKAETARKKKRFFFF
ncbi:MAG: hypothetical protein CMK09_09985 [Ponticaulis sp.]|nr:hypothetical protein [Ponticaulis sp.]